MVNLLVSIFIKDRNSIHLANVRKQYGVLSSCIGICLNILLFFAKYAIGVITFSISITGDAFNNLSDAASCIVALVGYKAAAKPADREHPFGHGRVEYLISLLIAVMIIMVGVEFLKTSIDKILHPEPILFSTVALVVLLLSIAAKCWLYFCNKTLGKRIHSAAMLATATDSLSDVFATFVTLVALVASQYSDVSLDGYMGLLVSLFILYAGYRIIKETVDSLLGQSADDKTIEALLTCIRSHPVIYGVHDVIVHNYGPNKMLASAHVEVSSQSNIMLCHEEIDHIEKEIRDQLGIMIVLHIDPIMTEDINFQKMHTFLCEAAQSLHVHLMVHDLCLHSDDQTTEAAFDLDVPMDLPYDEEMLQSYFTKKIQAVFGTHYRVNIYFDHGYVE